MRPIPLEDSYVHWVSEGLVAFFEDLRYTVFHDTVGLRREADVPLDRVYSGCRSDEPVIVFAFQFKTPWSVGPSMSWKLVAGRNRRQFSNMRRKAFRDWIWYCLPYLLDVREWKAALHMCHICRPTQFCESAEEVTWIDGNLMLVEPDCAIVPAPVWSWVFPQKPGPRKHASVDRELDDLTDRLVGESGTVPTCPYAITAPDSWGTFYRKLLLGTAGVKLSSQAELEDWSNSVLPTDSTRPQVLVAMGDVTRAVSVVARFEGQLVDEDEPAPEQNSE